jgi:FkbM family methyltransferase
VISFTKELIKENGADGVLSFAQRFSLQLMEEYYNLKKGAVSVTDQVWRKINFEALNLHCDYEAKLLLNPADEGFSKEFYLYGFREPLNTFAIFNLIRRKKPFVLDIGSNIGYFPLVELQSGAKHVVAIEPVPLTFSFLAKTLKNYEDATPFNIAMSDKEKMLKLYVAKKFNVTSSQADLLKNSGHEVFKEIMVHALPLSNLAEKFPIELIRLDLEGHEYFLLGGDIPDRINTICMELHFIPPFGRSHVRRLFKNFEKHGFKLSLVIDEMPRGFYPLVNNLGLEATYKLINNFKRKNLTGISYQQNVTFVELADSVKRGIIHLILEKS